MEQLRTSLFLLIFLSSISFAPATRAQTIARKTEGPFGYNVSLEVILSGTVSVVLKQPAPGMIMGSHLLLATTSGPVDASLGRFALLSKVALPITPGQQVEVTGVVKTINGMQVLLARTVKTNGALYVLRNARGFVLSPQAQERAKQKTAGEEL